MNNKFSLLGETILIVGGAGFVGSNLTLKILEHDPREIIIVDNLLSSERENIPNSEKVKFIHGSINDDQLFEKMPEALSFAFHLGCYHGNQSSIFDPYADHENNSLTSLNLFEKLTRFNSIKKVVYAAAACAVAEKTYDTPAATEEDSPVSLYHDSPYSISKIIGELYANYFFSNNGLPVVKARFSNVYGPREILGAGQWRGTQHTVWRNVVPTFIWKAMQHESLPLDNGGETSRDFIYVEDMARGLIACALNGVPGEVYNLATGVETKILDLAETINSIVKNPTPVELLPARDWDRSGKRFASTSKAKSELGFRSEISIAEGLRRTVEWTQSNKVFIKNCMEKHSKFMSA